MRLFAAYIAIDSKNKDVVRVVEARIQRSGTREIIVNSHEAWRHQMRFNIERDVPRTFSATPREALARLEKRIVEDVASARRKVAQLETEHKLVLEALFAAE